MSLSCLFLNLGDCVDTQKQVEVITIDPSGKNRQLIDYRISRPIMADHRQIGPPLIHIGHDQPFPNGPS